MFDGRVPEVYAEAAQPWDLGLTANALAASGAQTYSDILDVARWRRLTLYIDYDPHASATAGYPKIIPFGSAAEAVPAAGDDSWYSLGVDDGAVTAAVLTGTVPSGADWSLTPEFGWRTFRGLVLRLEASDNGSDEYRVAVTLDVTPYRWIQLATSEVGDTTNAGSLIIKYSRSV